MVSFNLIKRFGMKNILVLGIGNVLMNDDGAGAVVAQKLSEKHTDMAENVKIVDGGTLGLDLLPYIEWSDKLILVDAVDLDLEPGTVVRIEGEDIDPVFESKLSVHQMGMKDMLLAAELSGYRPEELVFFGIQTANVEFEMKMSDIVTEKLEKLQKAVEKELLESINS